MRSKRAWAQVQLQQGEAVPDLLAAAPAVPPDREAAAGGQDQPQGVLPNPTANSRKARMKAREDVYGKISIFVMLVLESLLSCIALHFCVTLEV